MKDAGSHARRPYNAESRRAAAVRSRLVIVDACRELLLSDGYRATTLKRVAARAGVSVETVYKAFGAKPQLVKAVYDITLAGDDKPVAMADRPIVKHFEAIPEPYERIQAYADFVVTIQARLGGMLAVLAEAGDEVEEILRSADLERLQGLRRFVGLLAEEGMLSGDLSPPQAVEACWALTAPANFVRLVRNCGWPPQKYADWLASMIAATLMPPPKGN